MKMETTKTVLHRYRFDVSKPEQNKEYKDLCNSLKENGLKVFCTWGGGNGHYCWKPLEQLDDKELTLETDCLFENQWNTAPIEGINDKGLRVFDWAEDYPIDFPKNIKRGYYLEQTPAMVSIRENTVKCRYCGKQEPAQKYVFCPHCINSPYLTLDTIHLTRMMRVSDTSDCPKLTDAEKDYLLPIYSEAQVKGNTARGMALAKKAREDAIKKYEATIEKAMIERDGVLWLLNRGVNTENCIYYSHTKRFCFGWRNPLSGDVLSHLLDILCEFPFDYEIKKV